MDKGKFMQGKIVKGISGFYYVHVAETGIYECKAKGIFRNQKIKPLVGDDVEIVVLDEEKKIVEYFMNIDRLITLHQKEYDKLLIMKKAMLEKMFPKNGNKVPEVRFSDFDGAWGYRKLGTISDKRMYIWNIQKL